MEKKKILIVDDEPDVVRFIGRLLTDNGYAVVSAHGGAEAIKLLEDQRPALILLDLQMPYVTGTDVYRQIRSHQETKDIPVIVVSGIAGRRISVGRSVPVLDKPIDEEQLLHLVQDVFEGRVVETPSS